MYGSFNDPYIFLTHSNCIGRHTVEITDGQSWSNYIGPKRDNPQVCLTRPVFTPFPLKVAWSGISLITYAPRGGRGSKPPIHFHCVLHAKRGKGGPDSM